MHVGTYEHKPIVTQPDVYITETSLHAHKALYVIGWGKNNVQLGVANVKTMLCAIA